jgi:type VI secretion system protein VasG
MTNISRRTLFGKLNAFSYGALENATAFCKLRGHAYVELVHWIYQLLDAPDSDMLRLLRASGVDAANLARDVTRALDRLPRGATAISDFSPHLEEAAQEAWIIATLGFGSGRIRSGHLLLGCLSNRSLRNALTATSAEFAKLGIETLNASFAQITADSPEADTDTPIDGTGAAPDAAAAQSSGRPSGGALARYAIDLTARARAGEIDPVIGRDAEIRQIIDVLLRRRQNNPILTGEAGVGKTAVVEGLACRIVAGEVPPALRQVALHALDLGLLQAGAGVKGEFEERLRQVIEEVQTHEQPIVLFIDEAHALIGAGGQEGTGDAANLLKPALARGTLRTIAATTWSEYKRYIEKDPALTRRFQPIPVNEPDEAQAIAMMRRMAGVLERHHGVEITDDAVAAAVTLSHRYIPARQLPDKSLSLLDTACARVAVGRHAPPSSVEHQRHTIAALELELEVLGRQAADGEDVGERRSAVETGLAEGRLALEATEARWQAEGALVDKIRATRAELRASAAAAAAAEAGQDAVPSPVEPGALRELERQRLDLSGETPLVPERVDRAAVAAIVQDWTGIPVGRLLKSEAATLLTLSDSLGRRVIGQDHAMEAIARRVQTSRAGLDDPDKPIGVFLLCGPSGVGKTETAIALAEQLQGGVNSLVTINMSEFQEAHSVSGLKGAPPGYVGFGQGGRLTEAVRRRPHAIILLDEIEKAHPDVHEIFFQVFDKGVMEDGEGRRIDFKNTLILMTSNVGSEEITKLCRADGPRPDSETLEKAIRKPLLEVFPPALLGRMIPVPYYPLTEPMLDGIIRLRLQRITDRLMRSHGVPFSYSDAVVELIIERAKLSDAGGRVVDALLTHTVLPTMSRHVFTEQLEGRSIGPIRLDVADHQFVYDFGAPAERAVAE